MRNTLLSGAIWHFVTVVTWSESRRALLLMHQYTQHVLSVYVHRLYGFNCAYNSRLPAVDHCFHRQRLKAPKMYMSTFDEGSIFLFLTTSIRTASVSSPVARSSTPSLLALYILTRSDVRYVRCNSAMNIFGIVEEVLSLRNGSRWSDCQTDFGHPIVTILNSHIYKYK